VADALSAAAAGQPVTEWGDAVDGATAELARCMGRVGEAYAGCSPAIACDSGAPTDTHEGGSGSGSGAAAGPALHDQQEHEEEERSVLMDEEVDDEASEEAEEGLFASQERAERQPAGGRGAGERTDSWDGSMSAVGVTTSAFIAR